MNVFKLAKLRRPALLLATALALPASGAELDHAPLSRSENLTYAEVLDNALSNAPEQLSAESRVQQAARYSDLGASWFSGNPRLETSYIDDSAMSSVGLTELEAGLQFALWRPGERAQAQQLGRHYESLLETWRSNLALEIAGRLRSNLADLQQAEAGLTLEREAVAAAQELLRLTRSLFEAGEAPRLDVMQAQSLLLQQQQRLVDAEAALVDAEREYTVLTGLMLRPQASYREQQSPREEVDAAHPLLRFLQANLDVAGSRVDQVKRQATGSPTLGFGVRRERGGRMDDYVDSLGVSLSIPLGKSAAVASVVSDARRDEADLDVALRRGQILLNQQLHEAEHRLFVVRQQLAVSALRSSLSEQRLAMARSAYELGESDLLAVIIALQESLLATQEQRGLELQEQRLISDYNQSLGIMP